MRRILKIILSLLPLALLSCSSDSDKAATKREEAMHKAASSLQTALSSAREAKKSAVDEYLSSLPADILLSQLFLVNIVGNEDFIPVESASQIIPDCARFLAPGGCLLFSYNIAENPRKQFEFSKKINAFYKKNGLVPPYLAVDQEGGWVNRLKKLTSPLPSQKDVASKLPLAGAKRLYSLQAKQMALMGISMNLAPVAEIESVNNAEFLDGRSFGEAEKTLAYTRAAICAYETSGIGTVLKHFPGNTNTDPHTGLPHLKITRAELDRDFLPPFEANLKYSSAVLLSHACVSVDGMDSDSKTPADLSKFWISDVIRSKYNFDGLVLSDDIFMAALEKNGFPPEKACLMAINAGVDVIMLSEKKFGSVAKILYDKMNADSSFKEKILAAARRVIQFKIDKGILTIEESAGKYQVMAAPFPAEFDEDYFSAAYNEGKSFKELR